MNTQYFNVGQCLKSNLGDVYVVSELIDVEGIRSYVLLALKSQVATTLSHGSIVRSRWKPIDQVISLKEISQRKKDIEQTKQLAELLIRKSPEFAELETYQAGENKQVLAVRNISKILKLHFNGVKFSVKRRSHDSVYVSWEDGPMQEEIKAIIGRFQNGCLDKTTNSYEYGYKPFNDVFGGIKFIYIERNYSDELITEVIAMLSQEYEEDIISHEHTPEAYRKGDLLAVGKDIFINGLQGEISRRVQQLNKYFK
ncbi:LPD29 domain-containing protein [Xenorhabdus bovienii]|uniref:LPD29 domain-containing protein n=1 Tax=Xenorhabdus bovienii TaxID=40576 RepID=UPI003DA66149